MSNGTRWQRVWDGRRRQNGNYRFARTADSEIPRIPEEKCNCLRWLAYGPKRDRMCENAEENGPKRFFLCCFGSRRSKVQISPPRLNFVFEWRPFMASPDLRSTGPESAELGSAVRDDNAVIWLVPKKTATLSK